MKKNYSANELEQLQQRAVEGDAEAQELWGMALQYGDGVEVDHEEASRWYQRAAEQGLPLSQGRMGWNYLTGNSIVEQDSEKGFSLLKTAIEAEDAGAYASMSLAYTSGIWGERDPERAVTFAQKAIERGSQSRSRFALAEALLNRDVEDVDISAVTSMYESVLVAEDIDLATKEVVRERLEFMEKLEAANRLRDELREKSHVLGPAAFKQAGEDFLGAVDEILHGKATNGALPSTIIQNDQDDVSKVPENFFTLQEAAFQAMEELYPIMQEVVNDPDMNMGVFPFFVQHGDREVLLVLHEGGSVERLEEEYELPDGSFSQDVEGLVTVEVPVPLGVLRFIQVLPDTHW